MPEADPLQLQVQDHMITHSNAGRAEVALTFDDGPCDPYTLHVLDILRFYGVQATFFCIGKNVSQFPEVVERMQREGHLVENHTWSHQALTEVTDSRTVSIELTRCIEAIEQVTGVQPTFFRPPYGKFDVQVLSLSKVHRLMPVLWSIDSRDWTRADAETIYRTVVEQVHNGAIVLMHDGEDDRTATVEALPRIIEEVLQRHLQPVTLRQLIS